MSAADRDGFLSIPGWARDSLAVVGAAAVVASAAYGVSRLTQSASAAHSSPEALKDGAAPRGPPDAASGPQAAAEARALSERTPTAHLMPAPHVGPGEASPLVAARAAAGEKKRVRIYVDGCFDMMHYGHSNALRQARALGDELVVGLVSDSEIVKNKGSEPLMPFEERLAALTACKFVDEVIAGVDYELSEGWVNTLLSAHEVDFIAHGDDPCITADGKDAYDYPKRIGKFRMFKRTEGVSTTDLVGRMLLRTREHHIREGDRRYVRSIRSSSLHDSDPMASATVRAAEAAAAEAPGGPAAPADWKFMPTSRRIAQFAESRTPRADDRVVYIAGSWDLFHAGHAAALREARKHGDFVLVGVYDDETVHKLHGKVSGAPVMNLFERALSVLACRYVDDVVMGAPLQISNDLIRTFNVDKVVMGTVSESRRATKAPTDDPRALPHKQGMLHQFASPLKLSSSDIIDRVMAKRSMFESKVQRKRVAEDEYRETRGFVEEA